MSFFFKYYHALPGFAYLIVSSVQIFSAEISSVVISSVVMSFVVISSVVISSVAEISWIYEIS